MSEGLESRGARLYVMTGGLGLCSVRATGLLRVDPRQGRGGYQMEYVPATAEQVFVRQCQAPV